MALTIIKRIGGKVKLREWIRSKLPPHNTYCEPFGGSFAVGLCLPRIRETNYRVVFNDLDHHVFNLFQVLRDHKDQLIEKVSFTPYSREEFEKANDIIHGENWKSLDPIEWARLYLITNRQSFAGKEDGTWCITRKGENICHTWKGLPSLMVDVSDKLRSAYIENSDYKDVFRRWDSPETCFYLDPPYEEVESDYYHVNKDGGFNHIEMAEEVAKLQGSIVISYYDSEHVRSLYPNYEVFTKDVVKHMTRQGKGKSEKDKGKEILLVKYSNWAVEHKVIENDNIL